MDLEIRHLKLVVAIAEEGSVTKAGRRLYLTQSALSHQLRDIEQRLGAPLFHRSGRRMLLTPTGEKMLGSARSLLAQLERAEEEIRAVATERHGSLRLSTECYTCYNWLPILLKEFGRKFPKVDVTIVVEATRGPIEALLDGKLDVAIVSSPVRDRRLVVTPLFDDEMLVLVATDHRLASRAYVKPEDFRDEHLYLYSTPEESTFFQTLLVPAGVRPKQVTQAQLTEAIVQLVKAGLGVAVLARWVVEQDLRSGAIRGVPLTRGGFRRTWSAARLRARHVPAYIPEFIRLMSRDPMGVLQRERRRESKQAG
ncbi:MAG: LysR family transcriptional regulator [Acidobacteria bacterium]|nr:LysR family transcriptional regulator [Acidobacteriota bacterium]